MKYMMMLYVNEAAIEAADAALSWAARCPAAERGVIEVRPLAHM